MTTKINYCFIVDANDLSGSPSGKFLLPPIDTAKAAIESFLKIIYGRNSNQSSIQNVQVMLQTTEQDRSCILCYPTDTLSMFERKLKFLTNFSYLSSLNYAVEQALVLQNKIRNVSDVDNFGHGICPWFTSPSYVIMFVDGNTPFIEGEAASKSKYLTFPAEFVSETFRWDQRLYIFLLGSEEESAARNTPLSPAAFAANVRNLKCRAQNTGGDLFIVNNTRAAIAQAQQLAIKLLPPSASSATQLAQQHQNAFMTSSSALLDMQRSHPPVISLALPASHNSYRIDDDVDDSNNDSNNNNNNNNGGGGSSYRSGLLCDMVPIDATTVASHQHQQKQQQQQITTSNNCWRIPECFWMDENVERCGKRRSHPHFRIHSCTQNYSPPGLLVQQQQQQQQQHQQQQQQQQQELTAKVENALLLAADFQVPLDSFALCMHTAGSERREGGEFLSQYIAFIEQIESGTCMPVSIEGSGKNDAAAAALSAVLGSTGLLLGGSAGGGSDRGNEVGTLALKSVCGFLVHNTERSSTNVLLSAALNDTEQTASSVKLILGPYNIFEFLGLLERSEIPISSSFQQQQHKQQPYELLKLIADFQSYLSKVPSYLHSDTCHTFARCANAGRLGRRVSQHQQHQLNGGVKGSGFLPSVGTKVISSLSSSVFEYTLHTNIRKRLQRMREKDIEDLNILLTAIGPPNNRLDTPLSVAHKPNTASAAAAASASASSHLMKQTQQQEEKRQKKEFSRRSHISSSASSVAGGGDYFWSKARYGVYTSVAEAKNQDILADQDDITSSSTTASTTTSGSIDSFRPQEKLRWQRAHQQQQQQQQQRLLPSLPGADGSSAASFAAIPLGADGVRRLAELAAQNRTQRRCEAIPDTLCFFEGFEGCGYKEGDRRRDQEHQYNWEEWQRGGSVRGMGYNYYDCNGLAGKKQKESVSRKRHVIPSKSLLVTWNELRRFVYGGDGFTARDIYLEGLESGQKLCSSKLARHAFEPMPAATSSSLSSSSRYSSSSSSSSFAAASAAAGVGVGNMDNKRTHFHQDETITDSAISTYINSSSSNNSCIRTRVTASSREGGRSEYDWFTEAVGGSVSGPAVHASILSDFTSMVLQREVLRDPLKSTTASTDKNKNKNNKKNKNKKKTDDDDDDGNCNGSNSSNNCRKRAESAGIERDVGAVSAGEEEEEEEEEGGGGGGGRGVDRFEEEEATNSPMNILRRKTSALIPPPPHHIASTTVVLQKQCRDDLSSSLSSSLSATSAVTAAVIDVAEGEEKERAVLQLPVLTTVGCKRRRVSKESSDRSSSDLRDYSTSNASIIQGGGTSDNNSSASNEDKMHEKEGNEGEIIQTVGDVDVDDLYDYNGDSNSGNSNRMNNNISSISSIITAAEVEIWDQRINKKSKIKRNNSGDSSIALTDDDGDKYEDAAAEISQDAVRLLADTPIALPGVNYIPGSPWSTTGSSSPIPRPPLPVTAVNNSVNSGASSATSVDSTGTIPAAAKHSTSSATTTVGVPAVPLVSNSTSSSASSGEWQEGYSTRQQRPYWYSTVTGQSVWIKPDTTTTM